MEMLSTSDADIEKAAAALASGFLVAFPTETVYGLGADAFNQNALAKIFEAKGRPRFDPLIIHIAELKTLARIADESLLDKITAEKLSILSERLWPGPLTLILPKRGEVPDLVTSALPTAAIRFPSHPVAQKLIRLSTGAVAAPSANLFGRLSPTRASHVKAQLGDKVDYIIDGGKTQVGLESTVLDLSQGVPNVLRQGGTEREKIEALIGPVEVSFGRPSDGSPSGAPLSPGQLKSHYAPRTPLILCKSGEVDSLPYAPGEGRLYFSHPRGEKIIAERTRVLSETGNVTEAAANLFDCLHELDSLGLEFIRAEEAPRSGLGEAINDRLRRAEK
jgi:L-threonylcarbamoyladenylate synthase